MRLHLLKVRLHILKVRLHLLKVRLQSQSEPTSTLNETANHKFTLFNEMHMKYIKKIVQYGIPMLLVIHTQYLVSLCRRPATQVRGQLSSVCSLNSPILINSHSAQSHTLGQPSNFWQYCFSPLQFLITIGAQKFYPVLWSIFNFTTKSTHHLYRVSLSLPYKGPWFSWLSSISELRWRWQDERWLNRWQAGWLHLEVLLGDGVQIFHQTVQVGHLCWQLLRALRFLSQRKQE